MPNALIPHDGGTLSAALRWSDLPPDELHRRAAAACRDRDTDTLISLALAYLVMRGAAGSTVSRHTTSSYATGIRQLVAAFADQALLAPGRDAGFRWVRQLEAAGKSPSTIGLRLAGARTLYKALRWAGATIADPFADVRPARDPTPAWEKRSPYSEEEVTRLLAAADQPHDRALILLSAHAGLRAFEATGLQWRNVDTERGVVRVEQGKGRKSADVQASKRLVDALSVLPRDSEYVLPYRSTEQARRRLRRLCTRAEVPWRALHSLRHYCGTKYFSQSHDVLAVSRHLRHSNTNTTSGYIAWADEGPRRAVQDW